MLLSDADRELLFEQLGRHAAEGRLTIEELERRVAAIEAAEHREQAAAVMADLPPLAAEPPQRRLRWGRGHGEADVPSPGWQPTGERFRDPRSGRVMRVWVDPAGGRHYVADEQH
ncbi:MAG: DUF1707 domain-containing protein [Solirubrobacterales bacterium]|nr:DUF1707 domain-containing protein [Solirubrobacterales bacterium]